MKAFKSQVGVLVVIQSHTRRFSIAKNKQLQSCKINASCQRGT